MNEMDEKLYSKGQSSDELVKKYQSYIKEGDEVIFIFPIWWNNFHPFIHYRIKVIFI